MSEIFDTSAQYNDWQGAVAADNDVDATIQALLTDRGLKTDDEIVVGLTLYAGETYSSISAYLVKAQNYEEAKAHLAGSSSPTARKVEIDGLTIQEFVGLFKRFSVAMSWQGFDLVGKELNTDQ